MFIVTSFLNSSAQAGRDFGILKITSAQPAERGQYQQYQMPWTCESTTSRTRFFWYISDSPDSGARHLTQALGKARNYRLRLIENVKDDGFIGFPDLAFPD